MKWYEQINNSGLHAVASALGLTIRKNTVSPCPSCGAEKRGSHDKRLPIGFNKNLKGWVCHSCKTTGNIIDLISYTLQGKRYRELEKDSRKSIMIWSEENRLHIREQSNVYQKIVSTYNLSNDQVPTSKTDVEQDKNSPFRWEKDIHLKYNDNLYNTPFGIAIIEYLVEHRKIADHTIREFQIGAMMDRFDNIWIVIPLKNREGEVVNLKFRTLPTEEDHKKKIRHCSGREMVLFNANNLDPFIDNNVIITEGEFDVLSYHSVDPQMNVVSGTTGAKSNWSNEWLDSIEPFENIYINYDDDETGKEGAEKLSSKLGKDRCYLMSCHKYNDFNEYIMNTKKEHWIDDVKKFISLAQPCIDNTRLKTVSDYLDQLEELISNPNKLKGFRSSSKRIDTCAGGIGSGLWVITGDTGHGKTTWATYECWYQAQQGVPIMLTSFEQAPIGTCQKLLRCQLGQDFTKVSKEERRIAMNQLGSMPLYILDQYGNATLDNVLLAIRYATRRYDVKIHLIDHLGFLINTDQNSDERREIEKAVRELATIAVETDVTIFLICHPNNLANVQQRRVRISDLKGASAIKQDAHVGVVVQRQDITSDKPYPTTTLWFDKVRSEFGKAGSHCTLAFDPIACVYKDEWFQTPSAQRGAKIIVPNQ